MQEPDVLQRVRERAGELVAQNLRSASIVLRHMRELIVEAHGIGHSHKAIHASLEAAGLRASWNTYKSSLVRMKKATHGLPAAAPTSSDATSTVTGGCALSARGAGSSMQPRAAAVDESPALRVVPPPTYPTRSTSSATRVMDALQQARQVANSKDYGQIARDLYRQEQRNRRRKDRP